MTSRQDKSTGRSRRGNPYCIIKQDGTKINFDSQTAVLKYYNISKGSLDWYEKSHKCSPEKAIEGILQIRWDRYKDLFIDEYDGKYRNYRQSDWDKALSLTNEPDGKEG